MKKIHMPGFADMSMTKQQAYLKKESLREQSGKTFLKTGCVRCAVRLKTIFEVQNDTAPAEKATTVVSNNASLGELSAGMISAVCSNLSKGCEKQYKPEAAECFAKLAEYYNNISEPSEKKGFAALAELAKQDLDTPAMLMQMPL